MLKQAVQNSLEILQELNRLGLAETYCLVKRSKREEINYPSLYSYYVKEHSKYLIDPDNVDSSRIGFTGSFCIENGRRLGNVITSFGTPPIAGTDNISVTMELGRVYSKEEVPDRTTLYALFHFIEYVSRYYTLQKAQVRRRILTDDGFGYQPLAVLEPVDNEPGKTTFVLETSFPEIFSGLQREGVGLRIRNPESKSN